MSQPNLFCSKCVPLVVCDSFSGELHITNISLYEILSAADIEGISHSPFTIPQSVSDFPWLKSLNLATSGVQGTFPSYFAGLGLLEELHLSGNQLEGTLPEYIQQLVSLHYLTLNNNNLSGTIPSVIASLSNLIELRFGSNGFFGTIPSQMGLMTALRRLNFEENDLSGAIPTELSKLIQLEFLTFAANRLTGTIPTEFETFKKLISLHFSWNRFSGTLPSYFYKLPKLEQLAGYTNNLTGTFPSELAAIPSIQFLLFSDCKFSGTLPSQFLKTAYNRTILFDASWNRMIPQTKPEVIKGSLLTLLWGPQDQDECALGIYNCSEHGYCADGWIYGGEYTCVCYPGFQFVGDVCVDIDECATGLWTTEISLEGSQCLSKDKCINREGNFSCCKVGYQKNILNESECVDIDECATNEHNCINVEKCYNTIGSFGCCDMDHTASKDGCVSCFTDWILETDGGPPSNYYQTLVPYKNIPFDWKTCLGGFCDIGTVIISRKSNSPTCNGNLFDFSVCSYPCKNLSAIDTARSAVETLFDQLSRRSPSLTFMEDLVDRLFHTNVTMRRVSNHGDHSIFLSLSPCLSTQNSTQLQTLLNHLVLELVPLIPFLTIVGTGCSIEIRSSDAPPSRNVTITMACSGVILLLILIAMYFMYRHYSKVDWGNLPEEVTWSFQRYSSTSGWEHRGTKTNYYYFQELHPSSKEFSRVHQLYSNTLGGDQVPITNIVSVYNPTLLRNFIGTKKIMDERFNTSADLFGQQQWKIALSEADASPIERRKWVFDQYNAVVDRYEWNNGKHGLPILPVLHGTEGSVAEKIAETGFAALSSLDAGYYGKGIYFTSCASYTTPYIQNRCPVLILSWIVPGNVYPVIENPTDPVTLCGSAMKSGYNSHYAITSKKGSIHDPSNPLDTSFFDEFVIPQESQIVPAFILYVDKSVLRKLYKEWQRETCPTFQY